MVLPLNILHALQYVDTSHGCRVQHQWFFSSKCNHTNSLHASIGENSMFRTTHLMWKRVLLSTKLAVCVRFLTCRTFSAAFNHIICVDLWNLTLIFNFLFPSPRHAIRGAPFFERVALSCLWSGNFQAHSSAHLARHGLFINRENAPEVKKTANNQAFAPENRVFRDFLHVSDFVRKIKFHKNVPAFDVEAQLAVCHAWLSFDDSDNHIWW